MKLWVNRIYAHPSFNWPDVGSWFSISPFSPGADWSELGVGGEGAAPSTEVVPKFDPGVGFKSFSTSNSTSLGVTFALVTRFIIVSSSLPARFFSLCLRTLLPISAG